MKLSDILKILRDETITIDYLGMKEGEKLIKEIIETPHLVSEIENIPDRFWEEAKQSGLLFYSDYTWEIESEESVSISNRNHDIEQGKRHVKALILQRKKG